MEDQLAWLILNGATLCFLYQTSFQSQIRASWGP